MKTDFQKQKNLMQFDFYDKQLYNVRLSDANNANKRSFTERNTRTTEK